MEKGALGRMRVLCWWLVGNGGSASLLLQVLLDMQNKQNK